MSKKLIRKNPSLIIPCFGKEELFEQQMTPMVKRAFEDAHNGLEPTMPDNPEYMQAYTTWLGVRKSGKNCRAISQ